MATAVELAHLDVNKVSRISEHTRSASCGNGSPSLEAELVDCPRLFVHLEEKYASIDPAAKWDFYHERMLKLYLMLPRDSLMHVIEDHEDTKAIYGYVRALRRSIVNAKDLVSSL